MKNLSDPSSPLDDPGPADAARHTLPPPVDPHSRRRSQLRAAAAVLAAVPLGLLLVAAGLDPSPAGLGTHQQLGFPPCTLRILADIRCPSCGMTTAWAHFVRAQWARSLSANPGGFLLAVYSLGFALASLRTVWKGSLPAASTLRGFALTLIAIALVTFSDWALRLWAG